MSYSGINLLLFIFLLEELPVQRGNEIDPIRVRLSEEDPYFVESRISNLDGMALNDSTLELFRRWKEIRHIQSNFAGDENGLKVCFSVLNSAWIRYSDSCKIKNIVPDGKAFSIRWAGTERGLACNQIYRQMGPRLVFEFKVNKPFLTDNYLLKSIVVRKHYASRSMSGGMLEIISVRDYVLLPSETAETVTELTKIPHVKDVASVRIPFWSDHLNKVTPGIWPPQKKKFVLTFTLKFINLRSDSLVNVKFDPVLMEI